MTAVSGSGPAFLFRFLEAWTYASEELGLPPETVRTLARETLIGAAGMLRLDDTAARSGGLDALMVETLRAARDRGAELGR